MIGLANDGNKPSRKHASTFKYFQLHTRPTVLLPHSIGSRDQRPVIGDTSAQYLYSTLITGFYQNRHPLLYTSQPSGPGGRSNLDLAPRYSANQLGPASDWSEKGTISWRDSFAPLQLTDRSCLCRPRASFHEHVDCSGGSEW
jgi:hypothetical protein